MALSTDLRVREQYGSTAIAPNSVSAAPGGSFSQALAMACQTSGGTDYESYFQLAAEVCQIPADLLKAMAKVESDFNANAVSRCGAQGIMQLMPATARSLGVTNSFDPAQNIMGGAKYLRQMLDSFDGNVSLAVAAYNAGPNAVKKYGGVPPYQETQNYVAKVLGYAGSGASVPVPAVSAGSAEGYGDVSASGNSLTQDELAELILQMSRSSGVHNLESMRLLVQQILLQKEREIEEQYQEETISL